MLLTPTRALALATALAVALLSGCGTLDVPRADNYPATGQKKARAVHHWDVLAQDVATRVAQKLADWPAGEHPIYIRASDESSFGQGFGKLLRVHLLDRGVALSAVPGGVELEVQTQVVQHNSQVSMSIPMPWTVLATGIGVSRDWYVHYYGQAFDPGVSTALGLGVGLAMDLYQRHVKGAAQGGPTRTEVLVTTSLKGGDRYLAGSADLYYIEREDAVLYQPPPAPPPLAPAKTWQVVQP